MQQSELANLARELYQTALEADLFKSDFITFAMKNFDRRTGMESSVVEPALLAYYQLLAAYAANQHEHDQPLVIYRGAVAQVAVQARIYDTQSLSILHRRLAGDDIHYRIVDSFDLGEQVEKFEMYRRSIQVLRHAFPNNLSPHLAAWEHLGAAATNEAHTLIASKTLLRRFEHNWQSACAGTFVPLGALPAVGHSPDWH